MKNDHTKRANQAKIIREFRKIHRISGILFFIFFIIISITGILLGWKKHSNGYLLPKTSTGISSDFKTWLPLDSLHTLACNAFYDAISTSEQANIDRLDIRKEKGIVKATFINNYTEIQLDGTTGAILHIGKRHSDLLEDLHEGTFIDKQLNISNGLFKLIYTTVTGITLLLFSVTGFWLWYGPKRMQKTRKPKL